MDTRGDKEQWRGKIEREIIQAKRRAEREMGKMSDDLRATFDTIERSIKKNPKETMVIALALGAAIGAVGIHFLKSKKKYSSPE